MRIEIDAQSGFCFGVVYAIEMAEDALNEDKALYCLGDIVHNDKEVERLKQKGLIIINHEEFKTLHNCKVLIRAHGEPPETYRIALQNNIHLIDASCPVVLKLQDRVRQGFIKTIEDDGQLVIYGKKGHAEVNGLIGQTHNKAIIANNIEELVNIDYRRSIRLYSQTTQSTQGFLSIKNELELRILNAGGNPEELLIWNDTLCRQVSNREPQLEKFAKEYDVILFVSGKKSSNGKVLYNICKAHNSNSYMISDATEIEHTWLENCQSIGICGATSTPVWLMEEVKTFLEQRNESTNYFSSQ